MRTLAPFVAVVALACSSAPSDTSAAASGERAFQSEAPAAPAATHTADLDAGRAVESALAWLAAHQRPDGSWPSESEDMNSVGATGLALLAFLGHGDTAGSGKYGEVAARGVKWLKERQDPDSGLIGERRGHTFTYCHAIATFALSESMQLSAQPSLEPTVQAAVNCILRARNPYGAWRYDMPPSGDNDTSVTGWMVLALASAREAGLKVDPAAFEGALRWIDEVTDPKTGRCGYDSLGSSSSRIHRVNDQFPTESGEAMTAVSLLVRQLLGQTPADHAVLDLQADLLRSKLPRWDASGARNDFYYWHFGTLALFQYGGERHWKPWNAALKDALIDSQRRDGDHGGSWDPLDPWGMVGGRVYATALGALALEVSHRYSKLVR